MSEPASPTKLAPLHLRLFALILDYLLTITLLKLFDQLALGEHWDLRPLNAAAPAVSPVWAAGLVLLLLARDAVGGRSPGKWLTGIAVARADDPAAAAPLALCLLRNVTLPLLPLEGVLLFFDPYWRRLGDRLAGTVVVTPASVPVLRIRLMGMAVLFLGFLMAAFLVTPWNMRRSAAYQMAHGIAESHPWVVGAVGAPVEIDSSPVFALDLRPDGGSATLTFQAKGPRGETEARVVLRLATEPRRWELETVTAQEKAPEPLVKEAPARKP